MPRSVRGYTKRLPRPDGIDELLEPNQPFQEHATDIFFPIAPHLQNRWFQELIEAQQCKMAPLAFSGTSLELKIDEENKNKTIHLVNGCPKTLM